MKDIIIIGMGIGGVTAGIYAKRAGLDVLLLEKVSVGGLLNNIDMISNFPGYTDIKGPVFAENLKEQVDNIKLDYKIEEVLKIEKVKEHFIIKTKNNDYESKFVVLATGTSPKFLGLDNEKELVGRGLSTCALCDGNFFKGKDIMVVGSGNSALQESLYLSKIVNKVYLINRKDTFKGEEYLINKVKNTSNIEIIYNSRILKYNEKDEKLESVVITGDRVVNVSGVFVYIGYKPQNSLVLDFDVCNQDGRVIVNKNMESKVDGLYAIGDINNNGPYQLITASNDGMIAALDIEKKLR